MEQTTGLQILLVESAAEERRALHEQLTPQYQVVELATVAAATQALETCGGVDLLLTAYKLHDGTGLEVLDAAMGCWPPVPCILLIEPGEEAAASEALRSGAINYLVKGATTPLRLNYTLSNAVARNQAELQAQQRAREMGVVNIVLTALNRRVEEEPVLDTIVQEVHALMGTDACSILLVDEESDQMFLRASTRLPVRDMVWPVPLSKSIAGRVVRNKRGEITRDVHQDPEWYSLNVDDLIPSPVNSMLTVPLLWKNRVLGVLQAINKRVGPFLDSDLNLMEAIAAVATAAIVRGQQVAELQHNLDKQVEQATAVRTLAQNLLAQVNAGDPNWETVRLQMEQLLKLVPG